MVIAVLRKALTLVKGSVAFMKGDKIDNLIRHTDMYMLLTTTAKRQSVQQVVLQERTQSCCCWQANCISS